MSTVPTSRLEAFSDGIIAIIITIMVFDLKLTETPTEMTILSALQLLIPKIACYVVSFVMVAIMWVNHHQLFHQIRHSDRGLLWYNIHLLFWMSWIPFGTNVLGSNPFLAVSACLYGLFFFMNALAFTLLRNYANHRQLLYEQISRAAQQKVLRKNRIAMALYLAAAFGAFLSVYLSFALFLVVPALYVIPEKITHENP